MSMIRSQIYSYIRRFSWLENSDVTFRYSVPEALISAGNEDTDRELEEDRELNILPSKT
jgi:hypothetical protein